MTRRSCAACGDDPGGNFRFCSPCEGLEGKTVATPAGPARIVQLRPTGEFVVAPLDDSHCRQFRRSELGAPIDTPPAPIPAAVPVPAGRWVDTHGEMIAELADEDTRAALRQLELEEETRLERIWRAHRLELLLRDFPAWAFPQPR